MTTDENVGKGKRIVIKAPVHTSAFLDTISRYARGSKQELYNRIWAAGLASTFGITEQELTECEMISAIPADVAVPHDDLRKLTDMICGE